MGHSFRKLHRHRLQTNQRFVPSIVSQFGIHVRILMETEHLLAHRAYLYNLNEIMQNCENMRISLQPGKYAIHKVHAEERCNPAPVSHTGTRRFSCVKNASKNREAVKVADPVRETAIGYSHGFRLVGMWRECRGAPCLIFRQIGHRSRKRHTESCTRKQAENTFP